MLIALHHVATIIKLTRRFCSIVSKAYLNIMQPSSANYRYCTNHPLDPLT